MIAVRDLVKQTNISMATLCKYRDMGMIPRPEVQYHNKGRETFYSEDTINILKFIKEKKEEGYPLHRIRDMLAKEAQQ